MDLPEEWDDETVQDAVDVLQDLVLWEMTPHRWEHVDGILRRIGVALAARDADALREAVSELEISGPVRMLRIGSRPSTGIPAPVLERRNVLVHSLTSEPAPGSGDRPAPEDDRDRRQPR